jgi:hypothetical protein
MILSKKTILLGIFIFLSCTSEKDRIIGEFVIHYSEIIEYEESKFGDFLSRKSLSYIEQLDTVQNFEFEVIFKIGEDYGIPYLTVLYFLQLKNAHEKSSISNFSKFITSNGISVFSLYELYGVSKKHTKIQDEVFVAVFKNFYGNNTLDWVRLEREENKYKIDLLYILQNYERRKVKDFQSTLKEIYNSKLYDFLSEIYDTDEMALISDSNFLEQLNIRKQRFKSEFEIR